MTRFALVCAIFIAAMVALERYGGAVFGAYEWPLTEAGWWLGGGLLALYILSVERRSLSSIGLLVPTRMTLMYAAIGLSVCIVGFALAGIAISPFSEGLAESGERLQQSSDTVPWWVLGAAIIRAGVVEEFFFRGFVVSRLLERDLSNRAIVVISTTLFILPHAFFWPGPYLVLIAVTGVCFALLFLWKRDLVACMLAHIGLNTAGYVLAALG